MNIITSSISVQTRGNGDIHDITGKVDQNLRSAGFNDGFINLFVSGSTGGLTTVEYESGLVNDLHDLFERIAPEGATYAHNLRWHDGNGHSHVLSALFKTSFTVPFQDNRLLLGTWQQIIFIDFDVKPRNRNIVVQIIGK